MTEQSHSPTGDERVTLVECPVGLFWKGDTLCLKTEYGNNEGRIDAYIIESGEFFWGDPPQTIASQRQQLVTPIDTDYAIATLSPNGVSQSAVKRMREALKGYMSDCSNEECERCVAARAALATQPDTDRERG